MNSTISHSTISDLALDLGVFALDGETGNDRTRMNWQDAVQGNLTDDQFIAVNSQFLLDRLQLQAV